MAGCKMLIGRGLQLKVGAVDVAAADNGPHQVPEERVNEGQPLAF